MSLTSIFATVAVDRRSAPSVGSGGEAVQTCSRHLPTQGPPSSTPSAPKARTFSVMSGGGVSNCCSGVVRHARLEFPDMGNASDVRCHIGSDDRCERSVYAAQLTCQPRLDAEISGADSSSARSTIPSLPGNRVVSWRVPAFTDPHAGRVFTSFLSAGIGQFRAASPIFLSPGSGSSLSGRGAFLTRKGSAG